MTTLPLGQGAYRRTYDDSPEVKLINRFVERTPANPVENTALLARPGTDLLDYFEAEAQKKHVRGCYSQDGIFGSDLFVVSGQNMWRYDGTTKTQIQGVVSGTGNPKVAYAKGAGYERMFITDGLLLQYYDGGTAATGTVTFGSPEPATGTLTYDGTGAITAGAIEINGTYYGWNADVDFGGANGTEGAPWLCLPGSDVADALLNMANAIKANGTPGTDFSTGLTANPDVTAEATATTLVLTAIASGDDGNAITTTVSYNDNMDWGATLEGGKATVAASQTMVEHAGTGTLVDTTVEINGTYYTWTTGSVDAGAPDGTAGNPWLIAVGFEEGSIAECIENFDKAINGTGIPGADYSTGLVLENPDVSSTFTATTLTVTARAVGEAGNAITTTMDSQTCSWGATLAHGDQAENYKIGINGTWYGWNAADVDAGPPDGSQAKPFLADPGTDPLLAMENMINFVGTRGEDFSTVLTTANTDVSASSADGVLTLTSRLRTTDANSITLHVSGPSDLLPPSGATLTGGGQHALRGIEIPTGESAVAVATLNGFAFVAVKDSQKFYLVRPGEVTIDALDFFSKESAPDPIVDMQRVGDVMFIMGSSSTEPWAATGNSDAPFAPIQGRASSRGIVDGTAVPVDESTIIVVGNDYRVYAVGAVPKVISDHGIEERIRRQIRREKGLI